MNDRPKDKPEPGKPGPSPQTGTPPGGDPPPPPPPPPPKEVGDD